MQKLSMTRLEEIIEECSKDVHYARTPAEREKSTEQLLIAKMAYKFALLQEISKDTIAFLDD